jgi:hypothetical protein
LLTFKLLFFFFQYKYIYWNLARSVKGYLILIFILFFLILILDLFAYLPHILDPLLNTSEGGKPGHPGNSSNFGNMGSSGDPGGPNLDPKDNSQLKTGLLPKDTSTNTLNSVASYNTEDLEIAAGSELVNVRNILRDSSLTAEEKEEKIMCSMADIVNELIQTKKELKDIKLKEEINIGFRP